MIQQSVQIKWDFSSELTTGSFDFDCLWLLVCSFNQLFVVICCLWGHLWERDPVCTIMFFQWIQWEKSHFWYCSLGMNMLLKTWFEPTVIQAQCLYNRNFWSFLCFCLSAMSETALGSPSCHILILLAEAVVQLLVLCLFNETITITLARSCS